VPQCGIDKKVKSGFMNKKQQYLCKNCGCNYTSGINDYSESVKKEALRYYTEGIGFRKIERLLGMSHVSVINWVKKAAGKLKKVLSEKEKVEVLELDETCVSFKKKLVLDRGRSQNTKTFRISSWY
jgi:transposase-like protein